MKDEIKDSIEAQLRIAKAYNYGEDLLEILNEEKDLYDYANELQQELERYKNIVDKIREYMLDIDYKTGWQYVDYLDKLVKEELKGE